MQPVRAIARRVRHRPEPTPVEAPVSKALRRWQIDPEFARLVDDALARAEGAEAPLDLQGPRARRLCNLVQALRFTRGIPGAVAECGTFLGASARLLCSSLRGEEAGFRGAGVHIFDSFEGLSPLSAEDWVDDRVEGAQPRRAGMFAATEEHVRDALSDFPEVELHKGWIPDCFTGLPDARFRLVHLDVDLYEPTLDALAYFVPRMSPGGVIVVDDYGAVRWPGVAQAVDEHCAAYGTRALELDSGQAIVVTLRDPAP